MQPPEPRTWFVDRSIGQKMLPGELRQAVAPAGERVIAMDDVYADKTTPDITWIPEVANKRWIILSKDIRIRRRLGEIDALRRAHAAAFVFTSGNAKGEVIVQAFIEALPQMRRIVTHTERPFVAVVNAQATVRIVDIRPKW